MSLAILFPLCDHGPGRHNQEVRRDEQAEGILIGGVFPGDQLTGFHQFGPLTVRVTVDSGFEYVAAVHHDLGRATAGAYHLRLHGHAPRANLSVSQMPLSLLVSNPSYTPTPDTSGRA
jgi:hypothetical protein